MTTTSTALWSCDPPRTPSARHHFERTQLFFDITQNKVRGNRAGTPDNSLSRITAIAPHAGARIETLVRFVNPTKVAITELVRDTVATSKVEALSRRNQ